MRRKTKNMLKWGAFLALLLAFVVGGVIYNKIVPGKVYDCARTVEPTNDGYFSMIRNNEYSSEVFKFSKTGEILKTHIEWTNQPLSLERISFGDVLNSDGQQLYFIRNYYDIKTNCIVKYDIVRLDDDGSRFVSTDVYSVEGEDLPTVCALKVEEDVVYVTALHSDKKVVQLKVFDILDDGSLFLRSTKKYINSQGEVFAEAVSLRGTVAAVTNSGKIYLIDDTAERLVYPMADAAQSAIGFLSADDSGFVFSDSETNLIYKYNILTDEVISESVEQFIYNNEQLQAFDILYVGIDGKKDCAALVTATTFDKVKVHAWNDGIPIDIQKFSVPLTVALARASEFICLSFVGSVVLMLLYQVAREFIWRRRGVIFRLMGIIASFVIVSFCALGYVDLLNIHTELYEMRYKLAIELRSQVLKTMPIDMVDELCNSWSSYSEAYNAILAESELTNRRAQVLDGVEGFGCYSQLLLNKTLDESDPCLVVGPSSFNNFLYPVENLYSESACAQFYDTLKTGGIEINVLTNDCGDWIVSSSPIKNKDGKILGVLLILVDVSSLPYDIAQESLRYAMFASIIILALLLLTYFLFKKALRPLSKLEGAFESVARGDYNVRLLDEGNDEFYRINTTFNKMCEDVANSVYKLKQIKGNYDKFVSEVVFKLFGDANVNNLNIGDHFETDLIFVLQGVGDLFEAGISRSFVRIDGMNTIEFLSQLFRIANGCAVRNGGVVLASTLGFGIMRALFDKDKAREAIDYSLDVLGDIRTGFSDGEELDFVTLLHKDHAVCGIVGDDNNAFPVAGSRDVERLVKLVPKLRRVGVRTAVTRSLVDDTKKEHSVRYLGFVGVPGIERRFELFEVLDGCDVEEKNQKLLTRVIFENGIKLFYAKEFYKARTEFAKVLQKYEKDKVARWYLLVCDKYFSSKSDNISFEFLNDIE